MPFVIRRTSQHAQCGQLPVAQVLLLVVLLILPADKHVRVETARGDALCHQIDGLPRPQLRCC